MWSALEKLNGHLLDIHDHDLMVYQLIKNIHTTDAKYLPSHISIRC